MAPGRAYQRTGDPFTQAVLNGHGPPTVIARYRRTTGRTSYTRVPVSQCLQLAGTLVAQAVRVRAQRRSLPLDQLVPVLALDWQPSPLQLRFSHPARPGPAEGTVRVTFQVTRTGPGGTGTRVWLTCPRCARRCGMVYASPWDAHGQRVAGPLVTGCRTCLGLTDVSRQQHKTPRWARSVINREESRVPYRLRGEQTEERAREVQLAHKRRAFRGLLRLARSSNLGLSLPVDEDH